MRKWCWCLLWPLALGACSVSATDNPVQSVVTGGTGGSATSVGTSGGGGGNAGGASGGAGNAAVGGGGESGTASVPTGGGGLGGSGAGMGGSATAGGGGDTNPSGGGAACAGLLCEDFETGQIDPAKWDIKMGAGGTQMVQQTSVSHGKYAWQVHGTGARGDFAMILTKSAPAALQGAGPVFGRAYLFATPVNGAHVELGFAGTAGYPNLNYMEFAAFSNSWQLGFDLFTPAPAVAPGFVEEASYPHPAAAMPTMKWSCIEWEFSDNPDMMLLWVDGQQIDQFDLQHIDYTSAKRTAGSVLNGLNSGIIGGLSVFGFGFHSWGTSSMPFDIYYDDIVLDTKRVNCLN